MSYINSEANLTAAQLKVEPTTKFSSHTVSFWQNKRVEFFYKMPLKNPDIHDT